MTRQWDVLLAFVPVERLGEGSRRFLLPPGGGQDLGKVVPRVSLVGETVGLLDPRDGLAGKTIRLRMLAAMGEDERVHPPPAVTVVGSVADEIAPPQGECLGFLEAAQGAELATEQGSVRAEEPELFSLLEPFAEDSGKHP